MKRNPRCKDVHMDFLNIVFFCVCIFPRKDSFWHLCILENWFFKWNKGRPCTWKLFYDYFSKRISAAYVKYPDECMRLYIYTCTPLHSIHMIGCFVFCPCLLISFYATITLFVSTLLQSHLLGWDRIETGV